MPTSTAFNQPLGTVLQWAGLISARQLKVALAEQRRSDLRIGEILAAHGWIQQKSADFFAAEWPQLQHQTVQHLGQYLEQAALLDTSQIKAILDSQQQTQRKFGTLAIANGWVRRRTVNFFLKHLGSAGLNSQAMIPESEMLKEQLLENESVNPFSLLLLYQRILRQESVRANDRPEQAELLEMGLATVEQNHLKLSAGPDPALLDQQWVTDQLQQLRPYHRIRLQLFKLAEHSDYPYRTLAAMLAWTGDQIDLTHKLGWLIRETNVFIAAGEEEAQVAALVQTHVIHHWESGIAAEHLQGLCDRISSPPRLKLYQRILEQRGILAEASPEEQELLTLGLIIESNGILRVANRIYQQVFSPEWVTQTLTATPQATDHDLPANKVDSRQPKAALERVFSPPIAPISDQELSATKVVASLSAADQQARPFRTVNAYSQDSHKNGKTAVFETRLSSPSTSAKPRRTLTGLALAAAGLLSVLGGQIWKQQTQRDAITSPSLQQDSSNLSALPQRQVGLAQSQDSRPFSQEDRPSSAATDSRSSATDPSETDPSSSSPTVVSASNPTIKVPILTLGSTLDQVVDTLGPPTWNRRGYYSNSRALLYEGVVPNQLDLGYLVSKNTGKLRQTETTFSHSVPIETIQRTLGQLLQGPVPASVQERLQQIYERKADQHTFTVRGLEGNIHWQPEKGGWIYIGVWDADFH
ncbi:hypothetical protein C1752_01525 [Acaryochloris thomasi RCC1774]|uniref:Uncharacterized protein n=1 Tax=Acaryochloris thomasi RCC1774 TaxID=1764569 RepID=A0A2W1K094_9CYAN|nr:hypothetical protein [Acaryochloris thomasi]PZD73707.1 hypothetical protein C1752_01525 [Acaryochloris thomasi RCC1774]